jgi:hypothetical protein
MGAITDAGAMARGVSQVAGMGQDLVQQHKDAMDATWVNEAVIENKKRKLEIATEARKKRENNPTGFAKEFQKDLTKLDDELARNAPSATARKVFKETTARDNLSIYESDFNWENSRRASMYAQSVENSARNLQIMALRAGKEGKDIQDLLNDADATTVAGSTFVSNEQLGNMSRTMRRGIVTSYLEGVTDSNPYLAKKLLDSKKYDNDLGADALDGYYDKTDSAIKKAEEEAAENSYIEQVISGNALLDPADPKTRKAVDKSFVNSGVFEGFTKGDAASVQETIDLVDRTSIIPESAQKVMRGYISNGTPEQKQQAYSFIGAIQEIKPAALTGPAGFAEKEIKDAAAYNALIRAGATPKTAAESITISNDPINKDIREMRQKQASDILKNLETSAVTDEYGSKLLGYSFLSPSYMGAENEARIFADYKAIYEDNYVKYGNADAAHSAALAAVKINAGETRITGDKQLMQFPPERHYGLPDLTDEENAKWMREEIKQDLQARGFNGDLDKVSLVPSVNSKARIDQGLKPQYHVFAETEQDGFPFIDLVRGDDNMPVTIEFNPNATLEKIKTEKAQQKTITQAQRAVRVVNPPKTVFDYLQNKVTDHAIKKSVMGGYESLK